MNVTSLQMKLFQRNLTEVFHFMEMSSLVERKMRYCNLRKLEEDVGEMGVLKLILKNRL
jgi:hypothetical protein